MKKPDWAETWNEESFDFGIQRAWAATVGPFSNAVRFSGRKEIKAPVYGERVEKEFVCECDNCGRDHTYTESYLVVVEPGVYEDVEITEEMVHGSLEDWFKQRAKECREFLALAEERGW